MAEAVRDHEKSEVFTKINAEVLRAVKSAPAYKVRTLLDIFQKIFADKSPSGIQSFPKPFLALV